MIGSNKRYFKKLAGDNQLTIVKQAPIWGKMPKFYRGRDWNIDGVWHNSTGEDILNSTDPFKDGSLMHKWRLNGDYKDLVTGTPATVHGPDTFTDGMFDSKMHSGLSSDAGGCYIDCGEIDRQGKTEITIAGWLYINKTGSVSGYSNIWHLTPDGNDNTGDSRQPALYYNTTNDYFYIRNDDVNNANRGINHTTTKVHNKLVHISAVIDLHSIKFYINGVLVTTYFSKDKLKHNNGRFYISNPWDLKSHFIQQVEMYSRALKDNEILSLYNQQHLVITRYDGIGTNPKPFLYLEENNMLVEATVDHEGNILSQELVKKEGYIYDTDNLVKVDENGNLVDRFGNIANYNNDGYFMCKIWGLYGNANTGTYWEQDVRGHYQLVGDRVFITLSSAIAGKTLFPGNVVEDLSLHGVKNLPFHAAEYSMSSDIYGRGVDWCYTTCDAYTATMFMMRAEIEKDSNEINIRAERTDTAYTGWPRLPDKENGRYIHNITISYKIKK